MFSKIVIFYFSGFWAVDSVETSIYPCIHVQDRCIDVPIEKSTKKTTDMLVQHSTLFQNKEKLVLTCNSSPDMRIHHKKARFFVSQNFDFHFFLDFLARIDRVKAAPARPGGMMSHHRKMIFRPQNNFYPFLKYQSKLTGLVYTEICQ